MTEHTGQHSISEPGQLPFSEEEWEHLQAQDRAGAKAIVVLLTGLFVVGLILYLIIAIVCS